MRLSAWVPRSILGIIFFTAGLVLLHVTPAEAKQSTVDPVFGGPGLGLAGNVTALAVQPDGKLLVAGGINHLQRLNTDGTADPTFHLHLAGSVSALAVQADGKILIAGAYHANRATIPDFIVRLYPNGDVDQSFNFSGDTDSLVGIEALTIALQPDGKILIGGVAKNFSGDKTSGLVRLHRDGRVDTAFNARIDRVPAKAADAPHCVYSVQVLKKGKILIGGNFTRVDGVARNGLARLNEDGSLDNSYQPAVTGIVAPGSLQADDKLLVASTPTPFVKETNSTLVRLNGDGSVDPTFTYGGDPFSIYFDTHLHLLTGAVTAEPTGQILVSDGILLNRVNPDGSLDSSFSVLVFTGYIVSAIPQADGSIFLGGSFSYVDQFNCNSVARLQADGSVDTNYSLAVNSGANGTIYSIAAQADGKVVIGGAFTQIDGAPHTAIARLNSDGTPDGTFKADVDEGFGPVFGFAMQSDGKLVLAGGFDRVNGIALTGLARLNPDGTLDTTFNAHVTLSLGSNPAIAVQADGKILVGENFGNATGQTYASTLIRLNPDGSLDDSFNTGGLGSYDGFCLALQSDGKILIAGELEKGAAMTRLNVDGSIDASFNVKFNYFAFVYGLAQQPDGKLLVCGDFSTVNGVAAKNLARLNADGSLDSGFHGDMEASLLNVLVETNGMIVVSGVFGDLFVRGADGSKSPFLPAKVPTNGTVYTLVPQAGGKILVGGTFSRVDGELRNFVARLSSDGVPDFFGGGVAVGDGFYYLEFANGAPFGYYNLSGNGYSFPYVFHADLGMEYFIDAEDGQGGAYLYDFASSDFFYTSPKYAWPYLYDFNLNTVLYYYPDPNNPGHYNTDGIRYFYDFATNQTIIK